MLKYMEDRLYRAECEQCTTALEFETSSWEKAEQFLKDYVWDIQEEKALTHTLCPFCKMENYLEKEIGHDLH